MCKNYTVYILLRLSSFAQYQVLKIYPCFPMFDSLLQNIPSYKHKTIYFSSLLLVDMWVDSNWGHFKQCSSNTFWLIYVCTVYLTTYI